MVVEGEVVVDDGVIGMIRFEQMLEGSRPLVSSSFDIMDLYRGQIDGKIGACPSAKEGRQRYSREAEHCARCVADARSWAVRGS